MYRSGSGRAPGAHFGKRLALSLLLGTALTPISPVFAQTAAVESQRNFSIPAGSLSSALVAFGNQAGVQVSYVPALAQGKASRGANGSLTPTVALVNILSGTGLVYAFTSATTVTIQDPNAGDGNAVPAAEGQIQLDPIYVTGGNALPSGGVPDNADQPYQTPGSSSFISSEQIERFPGFSAGDVFKSTPGVIAAGNHNGASLGVNIRGMQAMNRVKVTIDGTEQTTSTWRGYLGSDDRVYLDADFISSVGIVKGPNGGPEGTAAIGGVVAVRTLNAHDIVKEGQTFGTRIRAGANDNATSDVEIDSITQRTDAPSFFDFENGFANVAAATTQENFDFVIAAAKRKNGNYFAGSHGPTTWTRPGTSYQQPLSYTKPGEEVWNTSSDSASVLAKGTIRFADDHSLELGFTHYENEFGEAIGSMLTTGDNSYRQTVLADATAQTYNARYRWDPISDLIDLRINAYATDVRANTVSVGPAWYMDGIVTPDTQPAARDRRFSETWTYGTNLTNTSVFETGLGSLTSNYGTSYVLEDTNGKPYISGRSYANSSGYAILKPAIGTRETAGVFARNEWEPLDWLKFNADIRYDYFRIDEQGAPSSYGVYADKDGGRFNPSLGITVSPIESVQIYGLYAEGFRPPSLRESISGDSTLAPNPNLKPETAKNWEFGVNVSKDDALIDKDKARMKIAYFINNYDDYISRVSNPNGGPGLPFYRVANIDKAMFQGVEVSGSYDAGMVFAEAALTYYTDFEFCKTSSNCVSSSLNQDYALNHLPPKISTSLTLGMRFLDDKLSFGGRVIHNGERLGPLPTSAQQTNYWLPYTVLDAFLTYEVNEFVSVSVNGENLTDRYYIDALNGWMPSPGRTFRASMTARF